MKTFMIYVISCFGTSLPFHSGDLCFMTYVNYFQVGYYKYLKDCFKRRLDETVAYDRFPYANPLGKPLCLSEQLGINPKRAWLSVFSSLEI